ncbi:MAG: hypothetical protein MnENMB40S_24500 [Rhizobiaceae bacterium MnEN-MB40S]|nr:MAG: hypothetical protein MnENMB40S_24500 [Rhizobiaceae bacterium MnEN-MB40S]
MYGMQTLLTWAESWNRLSSAYVNLGLASHEVIWRRSVKLANGSLTPVELTRMVFEKPSAFAKAAERAAAAATRQDPLLVAEALVQPIGAAARKNAMRLRRG